MLSDEANRHLLGAAELASLDRILPWTRMVRDGCVTVDGETVDFREYAAGQRKNLVLKPTMMHGGLGVVLGWTVDDEEWGRHIAAAVDGPYVLQRRIRAEPEPFPVGEGVQPMLLNWGVFTVSRGYGGAIVRGSTDLTCCFHED